MFVSDSVHWHPEQPAEQLAVVVRRLPQEQVLMKVSQVLDREVSILLTKNITQEDRENCSILDGHGGYVKVRSSIMFSGNPVCYSFGQVKRSFTS